MDKVKKPELTIWIVPQVLLTLAPYILVGLAIGGWQKNMLIGFFSVPLLISVFLQWPTYWRKKFKIE